MSMRRLIDIVESESEESGKDRWKSDGFKSYQEYIADKVLSYLSSPQMGRVVADAIRASKYKTGGMAGSSGRRVRGNYDYTPAERIMMHFGAAKGEGPKTGESTIRKTDEKLPDGTPITWAAVKAAMASLTADYKDQERRARADAKYWAKFR
jgi:hypothetical protein